MFLGHSGQLIGKEFIRFVSRCIGFKIPGLFTRNIFGPTRRMSEAYRAGTPNQLSVQANRPVDGLIAEGNVVGQKIGKQ